MNIELTAEQAEQFKKEGKITIEMPKEEVKPRLISGWYIDRMSVVEELNDGDFEPYNYSTYATKEQAEASIAQARLTQEMKLVNVDWVADWSSNSPKAVIYFDSCTPRHGTNYRCGTFLAFKSNEIAKKFLSDHYDLIMAYKPLA